MRSDSAVGVVLTAAGSGTRFGAVVPKALLPLGGRPLVAVAIQQLVASGAVDEIVVTAPDGHLDQVREVALGEIPDGGPRLQVVAGGASRQASVAAGLAALSERVDVVLVHDAARPLASADLVSRLVATVGGGYDAVIPALPVVDTIKEVTGGDPAVALRTVDRTMLRAVQTPQAFSATLLRRAHHEGAHLAADERTAVSDDAGLVEALGVAVHVIDGEQRAMKVTTTADLAMAELLLRENS